MELTGRRYERTGVLAVDPMAFTMLFAEAPSRDTVDMGGVPVVTIRGPLEHHAGMWCDNYDSILARASEALSGPSRGVVLRIDSPGGFVSGCMETARAIRALADGSGKTLVAYVDGQACSAAYALACVAHTIVAPQSATLGSIGVLMARTDASEALASAGVRLHLIKSGARKGDGTAEVPVSADELAAIQDTVDTQAALFFDHVAAFRAGTTVESVTALQAGVLIGARAVAAGLADVVGTLDDALALARGERVVTAAEPQTGPTMATMAEALEALHAAAEGDNEEEAAQAKRMLAAMEPEDKEPEAEDETPPPKDDEPPKKDDEDTSAKAIALRAEASASRAERATILATRPDLSAETKGKLAGVPVAALAAALSAIPRAPVSPTPPKAEAPVLGEGQGGQGVTSFGTRTIEPNAELDRAMGISKSADAPITRTATYTQFGTLTRAQADETLKKIGGAR